MGQAKKRGTFEQRKLEAQHAEALRMEARRVQIEARKEVERQRRAVEPQSVRRTRHRTHMTLALGIALSAATIMGAK